MSRRVVVAGLVLSVGLVLVVALAGRPTAHDRGDQRDVAFGWPLAWIHQDQRGLDPLFPDTTRLLSPWEHPLSVSPGAFLADVAIVSAGVTVAFVLYRRMRR